MLRQEYLSVLEARTVEDLRYGIGRFSTSLGFDRVVATMVFDRPASEPEFISLNNVPAAYAAYFDDAARATRDPVAQHCKRSAVPIVWSQDTYTQVNLGDLWEEQAPFGFANGIGLALHMPHGRHFMFGVNRGHPLPLDTQEVTRAVAEVQLFAVHACEAAARLIRVERAHSDAVPLTAREVECLRWTMEGKTAWEVGRILGITERTAVFHVNSAAHKLDCASKHQAVIKAMRLGLIH
jgi:DNA-binding CsgD family transcriptional regulator